MSNEGRDLGDGRIIFRKDCPPPPEGWHEDPDNPNIWIMNYQDCKHRKIDVGIRCPSSGKIRQGDFCSLLKIKINPAICSTCPRIEAH